MNHQSKSNVMAIAVAASGIHLTTAFMTPGNGMSTPTSLRGADEVQASSAAPATQAAGNTSSVAGLAASGTVLAVAAALIRGRPVARRGKVGRRFFDSGAPAYKSFDPAKELGVQDPLGFWDPLGYCEDGDEAAFKRRRTVEIKHGRISMYACIGYIVPEYFKLPGYLSPSEGLKFEDVPNGLAALSKLPLLGGAQIVAFAGIIETTGFFSGQSTDGRGPRGLGQMKDSTEAAEPGNYGIGFPNFIGTVADPEERRSKLSAELANGRLAMVAIIGMFFQDGLTGSAWGDWALYTASPLRAFESELGVQAPLGFWDPLGYTADGSVENFQRRRATELKHGRISMLAAMGYITPEFFKFPGYLSPSKGLMFQDIPNGLAAVSKVPASGWAQMIAYAAYCELSQDQSPGTSAYAGDFGWKVLTADDPAEKTKKLSAEIANGRLAMMAIIGMFFQDGLTGSAWGDWANYTDSPLRAFESELGVQAPVGFWDPIGLSKDGDAEAFRRRRETEIKHGRVSMLATIGYITPEFFKFPGYLSPSSGLAFQDVPNGLAALSKVPGAGWCQIVLFAGLQEANFGAFKKDGKPGEYGWKMITSTDPAVKTRKLNAELANGRLAMMAIIGMFYQDGLTGSAWGDWSLYADSPLRAFESELGVQAPVGFWDPLDLSKDGDAEVFKRRRVTEIKHGRVSMLACLGYITPEYFKWPGYCSPSMGLKFADIPNGLGALSKLPPVGWLQIFLFCGVNDTGFLEYDDTREPGDLENAGVLGVPNGTSMAAGESRTKKLNAEIANGRLAMMAIIGMFFQDGLTGSAWGDWSLYEASPLRALPKSRVALRAEPISAAAAAVAAKAAAAASGAKAAAGAAGAAAAVSKPVQDVQAPPPFGEGEFDKTKQVGALPPLNYWDPCGLTTDEESFRKYRTAEIKHARVAMMASIGLVAQHSNRFVWVDSGVPSGVRSLQDPAAAQGFAVLFLLMGFYELRLWTEDESKAPGDFGDPAGWSMSFPGIRYDAELRNKELNNGRFAMFAVIGILVAEANTGLDAVQQVDAAFARWGQMGGFENF